MPRLELGMNVSRKNWICTHILTQSIHWAIIPMHVWLNVTGTHICRAEHTSWQHILLIEGTINRAPEVACARFCFSPAPRSSSGRTTAHLLQAVCIPTHGISPILYLQHSYIRSSSRTSCQSNFASFRCPMLIKFITHFSYPHHRDGSEFRNPSWTDVLINK